MSPEAPVDELIEALERRGEHVFLRIGADRALSARDVVSGARKIAAWAKARGIQQGDVVALRGLAPEDHVLALLGLWLRGAVPFAVGPREPDAVVAELEREAFCRARIEQVGEALAVENPRAPLPKLAGVATLLRTSGTSGRPKIAAHALENHVTAARAAVRATGLAADDAWLLSIGLHHVGGVGIVVRAILAGAAVALPPPDASLGNALVRQRPTHVSLVATQLRRLLDDPEGTRALAGVRRILVGGGPIPVRLRERALDAGLAVMVSYGSTESTALIAASADPEVIRRPTSAGRAFEEHQIEIGDGGEIRIGGPGLFRGYVGRDGVEDARDADGLFSTGDLGRLDGDAVLYVTGRRDRMFVSGGENVQPEEIEGALEGVPGVSRAVVVAVPSEEYGQRPVAFVEGAVTAAVLEAHVRELLAGFKVPDAFWRLPGGPAGETPDLAALTDAARRPKECEAL